MLKYSLIFALPIMATLAACSPADVQKETAQEVRPMDEVPVQKTLPNGDREYAYRSGCLVVLERKRAVVKSESANCQLHHRDISLLYASGD